MTMISFTRRDCLKSAVALALAIIAFLPNLLSANDQGNIIDISNRRELFVDHFLIDRLDGARLALHRPKDEGSVLTFDNPWERAGRCAVRHGD